MSKKKLLGLCIVHKNHNYGSILQSFATLVKLEELGIDYEIINYSHPKSISFYFRALTRLASKDTVYSQIRSLKKKLGKKLHSEYAANDTIRGRRFNQFISEHFRNFTKPINDYHELQNYSEKYTDVMVGSDQLWLPSGLGTNFYNLVFSTDETNKIAYAASFGVSSIPKYQREKTKAYLNRIQHISVREKSGQNIIREICGREVPVIVDPTLVITKEQWDHYIPVQEIYHGDYIFCYFLGNNPSHRDEARKLAEMTGMKIITLRHLDEYISSDEDFGDCAPYDIGPAEFVNLIRDAKYICTDSFHGSVFSIIYHKQFVSFSRYKNGSNSRNSRLDTLFNNIGIDRKFQCDIFQEINKTIDYISVDRKLDELRKFAHQYLVGAINDRDSQ